MLNFPLYRTLLGVDGQFIISCGNTSWLNHHLKEFLECADKWICHIMYGDVPSLTPIVQTHSSSGDMWRGLSGRFMTFSLLPSWFSERGKCWLEVCKKKTKNWKAELLFHLNCQTFNLKYIHPLHHILPRSEYIFISVCSTFFFPSLSFCKCWIFGLKASIRFLWPLYSYLPFLNASLPQL